MHPKRTIQRDLRNDTRLAARFWNKVQIATDADCWEWTAYRGNGGPGKNYGKLGIEGRIHFAHRIAWELTYGPIPDGSRVLHRCDNPPCCNPAHLFLGTLSDNMQDMWDKQRHGPRRPPQLKIPSRGESHHLSKLTAASVLTIRQRAAEGIYLQTLADEYGVTKQAIWHVVQRRTWKHV